MPTGGRHREYVVAGTITHLPTMLLLALVAAYQGFSLNQVQVMAIAGFVGMLVSLFFVAHWRTKLDDCLNILERDVVPRRELLLVSNVLEEGTVNQRPCFHRSFESGFCTSHAPN